MRKMFIIGGLFISSICLLIILFNSFLSLSDEKDYNFHVGIEQDGKLIEIKDGVVCLDKTEFSIIFEFNNPMGVLIHSSFKNKNYELASKTANKSELSGFEFYYGMAEYNFNPKKVLNIADDRLSYWYYEDDEENRFNSVEKVQNKLFCKRIIKYLYRYSHKSRVCRKTTLFGFCF